MKIIHCSDLHLDSKMEAHLSSAKARERKKEILLTFQRMIEYAEENGVTGIIIAGDMFDSPRVSQTTKNRVISLITSHKNIAFFYLCGNHDEENIISALENTPENLHIFSKDWQTFELDAGVTVSGTQLGKSSIYDMLKLDEKKFNIVVLHGAVSTADSGKETINIVKLRNKFIDYLALGHYHFFKEDKIDSRGKYCYCGCLEGRGFDELGEKGFVLLSIDGGKMSSKFVPFAQRRLEEIEVDITGINDFYDVEKKVSDSVKNLSENTILRVVLTGKYDMLLVKDIAMLEKKLSLKFYHVEIKDKSRLDLSQDFSKDMSLKGEFIRQVIASKLEDEMKEKIIVTGLKALSNEEVR